MYLSIGLRFNYVRVKREERLRVLDREGGQNIIIVRPRGLWASYLQAIDTYESMEYNNNKQMLWPREMMKWHSWVDRGAKPGASPKMVAHLEAQNQTLNRKIHLDLNHECLW